MKRRPMETVLTAVVTRLLKRFIKTEDATSDLRVRLNKGSVLLHDLDLNLDSLFAHSRSPIAVRRAFTKTLTVKIPWTALGTRPMELCLDTVEIVLEV